MMINNILWMILVEWAILKGAHFITAQPLNSTIDTQSTISVLVINATSKPTTGIMQNITQSLNYTTEMINLPISIPVSERTSTTVKPEVEIVEIFLGAPNRTDLLKEANVSSVNYTLVAEGLESSENVATYRLQKSAAVGAGIFLLSAIIGYVGCVGYRRHLQRKYGDSQKLAPEDVYDTSDLRYFEI